MTLQHFLIEGRRCGSREIPSFRRWAGDIARPAGSWAYFCPRCGDVWAKLDAGGYCTVMTAAYCRKHGDGTIARLCPFERWETEFGDDWPLEAKVHELTALLDQAEREIQRGY